MNPELKAVWNKISATIDEGTALAKHMYEGIKTDMHDLAELQEAKLNSLIDKAVEDETIERMANAFFANVREGKEAAVEALRREHKKYERKLEEMVDEKPEIVGFWDGFVFVFLAKPADRRPRSRIYVTHAKYGKAIAVVSSLILFLPAGGIRSVLGALPILVRGASYFQKKATEARQKMDTAKPKEARKPKQAKKTPRKKSATSKGKP